jgi:glycosyltransferase involved in cell wall biosynthesis
MALGPGIAAVIPAHPARVANGMLDRALKSVFAQTLPAAEVHVAVDLEQHGAAITRQRALDAVTTEWAAFLDSDDEWLPHHLRTLFDHARAEGADFAFAWFEPVGGPDPLGHFGLPFNPATPHHTTITVLVRTELARRVGFTPAAAGDRFGNEDWRWLGGICQTGARMIHVPERTWRWHMHTSNTSGLPGQGDA